MSAFTPGRSSIAFRDLLTRIGLALAVFLVVGSATASDLSFVEFHASWVGAVTDLDHAISCDVSPDGADVYVASNASLVMALGSESNSIAIFHRDPATGRLEFSGAEIDGVDGVDGLADPNNGCVDPLGQNVHVASWDDHALSVFLVALFSDGFESGDTTWWSGP